jgi:hypothetical protein
MAAPVRETEARGDMNIGPLRSVGEEAINAAAKSRELDVKILTSVEKNTVRSPSVELLCDYPQVETQMRCASRQPRTALGNTTVIACGLLFVAAQSDQPAERTSEWAARDHWTKQLFNFLVEQPFYRAKREINLFVDNLVNVPLCPMKTSL